jgi:hypothetical protein
MLWTKSKWRDPSVFDHTTGPIMLMTQTVIMHAIRTNRIRLISGHDARNYPLENVLEGSRFFVSVPVDLTPLKMTRLRASTLRIVGLTFRPTRIPFTDR